MRYCENCKLRYPDASRYCQQCGAKLTERPEPQRFAAAPIVNADKPRHPYRTILLVGILGAILLYIFTGFLQSRSGNEAPTAKPTVAAPLLSTNAYSIPARCAPLFSALGVAELDKVAKSFDLVSLTKQKDGSLSVRVKAGSEHELLSTMHDTIAEVLARLFDERLLPDFTSVRTDNGMQFTVFVTGMDLSEEEDTLTEELLRFGALYAAISGAKPEEAAVSFYSQNGGLYQTVKAAD